MAEEVRQKVYTPVFSNLDPSTGNEKTRIKLRRCVGRSIENVDSGTLSAFYSNVRCRKEDERKAFLIACLYCEQGGNGTIKLSAAWGDYVKTKGGNGDRLLRLLDSQWSDAAAAGITRAVRLLERAGYTIDLESLYYDIRHWEEPATRRSWAIAYSIATNNKEAK